jgi:hypothetical protein
MVAVAISAAVAANIEILIALPPCVGWHPARPGKAVDSKKATSEVPRQIRLRPSRDAGFNNL